MAEGFWLGYDFGGTNARAVVSGSDGEFNDNEVVEVAGDRSNGPMGVSTQLINIGREALMRKGADSSELCGIGICSAGQPDMNFFDGSIKNSPNLRFPGEDDVIKSVLSGSSSCLPDKFTYNGMPLIIYNPSRPDKIDRIVPLVQPLRDKFGVDVNLGNDVNVATIGIVVFGEGRDFGDPFDLKYTGVGVTHGTGYGGGVWTRGGILWGVDDSAAEVGHFRLFRDGAKCGCGNNGCAETLGSGSGSARRAQELLIKNRYQSEIFERARDKSRFSRNDIDKSPHYVLGHVDSKLVFEVYSDNPKDKVAAQVVREVGEAIGQSYGMIACAYNPSFIANFGSMTGDWPSLESRVMDELRKSCNVRVPDVFTTKLGDNVGLKGALGYAMGKGK